MPIDYSKWDNLNVSSSDDESSRPVVTKFDSPQSITIPGTNSSSHSIFNNSKNYTQIENELTETNKNNSLNNKSAIKLEDYCKNGCIVDKNYIWGQSRHKVWALISLPSGTRGKNLNVIVKKESLTIKDSSKASVLVDKNFPFTVYDEYDYYNWEILPHDRFINDDIFNQLFKDKVIFEINLTKLEKFDSLCSWWPCFFQGDISVDVENFKDRKGDNKSFMENWKKANEMFRERVANFKKIEL